ncbi:MAG TPA: ATP-binding protein [Candidatus Dormibacteraeota bacterium]
MRELRGFLIAVAGVAAVTLLIGLVRPWLDVPSLAVAYVLLVLWVASRWGRLRAIGMALLSYLAYEFFFVPPIGSIAIAAPRDALNLLVLLAAALLGGTLAASLREARMQAQRSALTSETLYGVAVSALRAPDVGHSLDAVAEAAVRIPGLDSMTLLDERGRETLAGPALTSRELERLRWALRKNQPLGIRFREGSVDFLHEAGASSDRAFLPMRSGAVALRLEPAGVSGDNRRLLAALLALAGLLLDRRKAELEEQRVRELEASDRLKAAVLSSISHEFKSPLAALRAGLSSLSMAAAGLEDEERELVQGLDHEADRLNRLVGDMLAMSRLESGLPLDRQPVSVAEMLGSALHERQSALKGRQIAMQVAEDLPPVMGDEAQLQLVVGNLLANAAEWTPAGGRIEVGAGVRDGQVRVWIQNQGEHIRPADLERIFDRFWSQSKRGSGLGLAIAKRVVEAHGGTIRADNQRLGPRFTLTLPAEKPAAAAR